MSTTVIPLGDCFLEQIATSKSIPNGSFDYFNLRSPTDPYFYGTLTIQNVLSGSNYWVAQTSDLTNVLATGTQSGSSDIVISSIPAVESPMLVTIRVRKAGYVPFETNAYLYSTGGLSYIIQVTDTTY